MELYYPHNSITLRLLAAVQLCYDLRQPACYVLARCSGEQVGRAERWRPKNELDYGKFEHSSRTR